MYGCSNKKGDSSPLAILCGTCAVANIADRSTLNLTGGVRVKGTLHSTLVALVTIRINGGRRTSFALRAVVTPPLPSGRTAHLISP